MEKQKVNYHKNLQRFARLLAGLTFLLIFIGGLVTSTGSGLAVPDWPTTYGHFMFSFPLSKMAGGILYEHGHRMVASVVGMLTVVLVVWLWLKEPRRWLKWFGLGALLAVVVQGILGGITVLYKLPTPISVLHGCLAQAFFMMTIAIAIFTSQAWLKPATKIEDTSKPGVFYLATLTTAVVYLQLILGAIMRHSGAGLAIPDFPLAFGKLVPPIASKAVAIHFLHRLGAVAVTICMLWTAFQVFMHHRTQSKLVRPTIVLLLALIIQITLAALTIWSQKAVLPTTAHVATGAFILGASLFLTFRAFMTFESKRSDIRQPYLVQQPSTS